MRPTSGEAGAVGQVRKFYCSDWRGHIQGNRDRRSGRRLRQARGRAPPGVGGLQATKGSDHHATEGHQNRGILPKCTFLGAWAKTPFSVFSRTSLPRVERQNRRGRYRAEGCSAPLTDHVGLYKGGCIRGLWRPPLQSKKRSALQNAPGERRWHQRHRRMGRAAFTAPHSH
jgi:hypothetical protein